MTHDDIMKCIIGYFESLLKTVLDAIMYAKQSYTKMFHSWYGNTEEMRRLALPFLIGRLLQQFLNELQDSKYKRINIFTAHDTTSMKLQ